MSIVLRLDKSETSFKLDVVRTFQQAYQQKELLMNLEDRVYTRMGRVKPLPKIAYESLPTPELEDVSYQKIELLKEDIEVENIMNRLLKGYKLSNE